MSIKDTMLEQLEIARRIVTDGHENVPAWRIQTPDGAWLILTRFEAYVLAHIGRWISGRVKQMAPDAPRLVM